MWLYDRNVTLTRKADQWLLDSVNGFWNQASGVIAQCGQSPLEVFQQEVVQKTIMPMFGKEAFAC